MTILQLEKFLDLTCLSSGEDRAITHGFCGDLLSWVMANAQEGCAWFTVMGNINAIAVASLNDIGCIILCQNSTIQPDALEKAKAENIFVFSTPLTAFEASGKFYQEQHNKLL